MIAPLILFTLTSATFAVFVQISILEDIMSSFLILTFSSPKLRFLGIITILFSHIFSITKFSSRLDVASMYAASLGFMTAI